jgi:flagellar protein FliS
MYVGASFVALSAYQRYAENNLITANPVQLVVEMYQGALSAVSAAQSHTVAGDPLARGRMVNRAMEMIGELSASLDMAAGGEVAVNLKELYGYMQHALLDGHARQSAERFSEVANLLTTLLEGWRSVAQHEAPPLSSDLYGSAYSPSPTLR